MCIRDRDSAQLRRSTVFREERGLRYLRERKRSRETKNGERLESLEVFSRSTEGSLISTGDNDHDLLHSGKLLFENAFFTLFSYSD